MGDAEPAAQHLRQEAVQRVIVVALVAREAYVVEEVFVEFVDRLQRIEIAGDAVAGAVRQSVQQGEFGLHVDGWVKGRRDEQRTTIERHVVVSVAGQIGEERCYRHSVHVR